MRVELERGINYNAKVTHFASYDVIAEFLTVVTANAANNSLALMVYTRVSMFRLFYAYTGDL